MKKILFFFAFALPFIGFAQNQNDSNSLKSDYFLTLTDGKIIPAKELSFEESYFKGGYILADKKQYNLGEVASYQSSHGFYKKYPNPVFHTGIWYKREEIGKINIYSKEIPLFLSHNYYNSNTSPLYLNTLSNPATKKEFYFQSGNNEPRKFTYNNLVNVVASNPKSSALVHQARNMAILRGLICVGGIVMMTKGIVDSSADGNTSGKSATVGNKGLGLFFGGLVVCAIPLTMTKPSKKYREAVFVYNKE